MNGPQSAAAARPRAVLARCDSRAVLRARTRATVARPLPLAWQRLIACRCSALLQDAEVAGYAWRRIAVARPRKRKLQSRRRRAIVGVSRGVRARRQGVELGHGRQHRGPARHVVATLGTAACAHGVPACAERLRSACALTPARLGPSLSRRLVATRCRAGWWR